MILYFWSSQTSSEAVGVCSGRTAHRWKAHDLTFPPMCSTPMVLLIQPPGSTAHVLRIPVISARTEFLVLIHWYFIVYIVVLYVYCKVMYRIQHSDRYPPLLRVSPRGLRALPQLGKCNSDPETWCARWLTVMYTAQTYSTGTPYLGTAGMSHQ